RSAAYLGWITNSHGGWASPTDPKKTRAARPPVSPPSQSLSLPEPRLRQLPLRHPGPVVLDVDVVLLDQLAELGWELGGGVLLDLVPLPLAQVDEPAVAHHVAAR